MDLSANKGGIVLGEILGGLAFTIIFMVGLFSGAAILSVCIRGLISGGVLAAAGFCLGLLLEHYAPGAWEGGGGAGSGGFDSTGVQAGAGAGSADVPRSSALDYVVGEDSGSEPPMPIHLPDGTEDIGATSAPPRASRQAHGDGKVVGNVRVIGERQFTDDPEDYAKAIRTMMSKDDG
ncbi:MAG: hypothetical protein LBC99_09175 [Spirochaetota bacterium]|jgi:hypothetical protein|nr:hypothetical protein [Spirochaetota bacterium]